MFEIFNLSFMQHALIAAILTGIICSILSVFITLKKMSFIGQGISHSAFGGVALGLLLGIDVNISAIVFTIIISFLITFITRISKIEEDSIIGVFLTFAMALGAVFLALRKGYTSDIMGYLFGNILAISEMDLIWLSINLILVLLVLFLFYHELLYFVFNEQMAKIHGVNVKLVSYLFNVLITLTIVSILKIVGIILISALLILPGISARLIEKRFKFVLLISICLGVFSNIAGLVLSYYFSMPSGSTIVLFSTLMFIIILGYIRISSLLKNNPSHL